MTELNEEERRRRVDTGMYDAAFSVVQNRKKGNEKIVRDLANVIFLSYNERDFLARLEWKV